jgi:putative transposase
MCHLLNLSCGVFYARRNRPPRRRFSKNKSLIEEIRSIYDHGHGVYATLTICAILRENTSRVNRNRIVRLMRQIGLQSKIVQRFRRSNRRYKNRDAAPKLLQQNFNTDRPNRVRLSNITHIDTDNVSCI